MAKIKFQTKKSCNRAWENSVIFQNGGSSTTWQNGLLAQYQFDEGSGTVLIDHSGHNFNGTLGNGSGFLPTWTSAGLSFGGAATVQIPTGAAENAQTIMVWCQPTLALANAGMTVFGVQNSVWGEMSCGFANGDGRPGVYNNGYSDPGFASAQPLISATASFCYRLDGTVWINATQVPHYIIPAGGWIPVPANTGVTGVWIGGYLNNIFFPFVGSVYYLMTWNRQLTSGEILVAHNTVAAVLAGRGISTSYNTSLTQQVLFGADGDSITRSYDDGKGYVQRGVLSLVGSPNYNYINTAVGGQASDNILANAPSELDPVLQGFSGTSVLNVLIGTNGGFTPTDLSNLQAYCAARYAAGWNKIVAVTGLPRGSTPGSFETARQTFNAALRSGINPGVTWDAVADWGSDLNMGQAGQAPGSAGLYGDGVHPSAAGHTVGAMYVKTAWTQVIPTKIATIYDTFTGTDATALTAHTPDINTPGHAWTNIFAGFVLSGNKAYAQNGSFGYCEVYIDSGRSDCTVAAVGQATNTLELILRFTNTSAYYRFQVSPGTSGNINLNLANTNLASANYPITADTNYYVSAVLNGAVIDCFVNNFHVIHFTTDGTSQTATKHGIGGYYAPGPPTTGSLLTAIFDNFIIA